MRTYTRALEEWRRNPIETSALRKLVLEDADARRSTLSQPPRSPGSFEWIAVHEAGHAVAEFLLLGTLPQNVSIHAQGGRAATAASSRVKEAFFEEKLIPLADAEPDIQIYLAGVVAEALVTREPRWELAQSDLAGAKMLAKQTLEYAEGDVDECLRALAPATLRCLADNWPLVLSVATALVDRLVLSSAEVKRCFDSARQG